MIFELLVGIDLDQPSELIIDTGNTPDTTTACEWKSSVDKSPDCGEC